MTDRPVIALRPEALDQPSELDVAQVEAMMYWPDDDLARDRWMVAAMVEWGWAHIEDMPEAELRRWALGAREARDVPSLAELRPGRKRWAHGVIAGAIVLEGTMLPGLAPEQAALGRVQVDLAQRLKREFQIEPRTMNNKAGPIYPFRPVAHLWAAAGIAFQGGDRAFPCEVSRLGEFLATAEAIRKRAERSRAKQSPSTVMRPGEAVLLPDEIVAALPVIELPEYSLRSSHG